MELKDKQRLLITAPFSEENIEKISSAAEGRLEVYVCDEEDKVHEMMARLSPHIVIGEPEIEDIREAAELKWVQMTWSGTDKYTALLDFPKGVRLTNARGCYSSLMSQYAVGAVLSLCRCFPDYLSNMKDHTWSESPLALDLEGKTVAVLGAGDVGTEIARRLKAFDTYNIGFRRSISDVPTCFDEMHTLEDLSDIIERVDVFVCCLPFTAPDGLFGVCEFERMKPTAIFVNIGRGNIVDHYALADALNSGKLFAAALDVTKPEPLHKEHPLWDAKHLLITPHIAGPAFGCGTRTEELIAKLCCDNIRRYIYGEPLLNLIRA